MRRERIDQDALFETHASVQLVGSHIVTVTGTQHLDLTADVELYPGVAIAIGGKLTDILGLTNAVNLKKL